MRKRILNHPLANGLYHLFIVISGMFYICFTQIIVFSSRKAHVDGVEAIGKVVKRHPGSAGQAQQPKHITKIDTNRKKIHILSHVCFQIRREPTISQSDA